jgi:hypothetical protein
VPDQPVVVGGYAYLDGALHVQVSLATDAIMAGIIEDRTPKKVSLAFLCSPTDVFVIDEVTRRESLENHAKAPLWQKMFSVSAHAADAAVCRAVAYSLRLPLCRWSPRTCSPRTPARSPTDSRSTTASSSSRCGYSANVGRPFMRACGTGPQLRAGQASAALARHARAQPGLLRLQQHRALHRHSLRGSQRQVGAGPGAVVPERANRRT